MANQPISAKILIQPDETVAAKTKFTTRLNEMLARIPDSKLPKIAVQIDVNRTKQVFQKQLKGIMKELSLDTSSLFKDGKGSGKPGSGSKSSDIVKENNALQAQIRLYNNLETKITKLTNKSREVPVDDNFRRQLAKTQALQDNVRKMFDAGEISSDKFKISIGELKTEVSNLNNQMGVLSQQNLNKQFVTNATNLSNQLRGYVGKNANIMRNSDFADDYNVLQAKLQDAIKNKSGDIKQLTQDVATFRKNAREAGLETESWGQKIRRLFKEHMNTAIAMYGIHMLRQSFQQMIGVVQELDKSLVNIQMVTGGSRSKTAELMQTYNQMAKELGATTAEVAASANEWLRQGRSIEETNKLIEASMILSKVGMLDSAQSTQYLTSAMKGYKVVVDDVMSITDKVSKIDMVSATSAAGLMEGMSRVANFANDVGYSMDKLLATLATIGEVTQRDMSSIGDSLRTMFARMSNIKLGKLLDEEGEDLSDVEQSLRMVGIRLRDNETDFRNFGDVLDEVASKWDTFNDVQKNTISSAFAGTRRIEDFRVLMSNYDNVIKYTTESLDSAGSAQKKFNDAYLGGIESSLKNFTASFENLSATVVNSGLLKWLIDLGSSVLNLISNLDNLTPLLVAIAGIIAAIKIDSIIAAGSKILSLIKNLTSLQIVTTTGSGGMRVFAASVGSATISVSALQLAVGALTAVISIGIMVWQNYKQKQQEAIDKANELAESYENSITEINDNIQTINSLRSEFDKLSKGVDENGKNIGLTADQYSRYKDIVNQIVGISPDLIKGYNEEGQAIVNNNTLISEAIELQKELNEQKKQEYLAGGQDLFSGIKDTIDEIKGNINDLGFSYVNDDLRQIVQNKEQIIEQEAKSLGYDEIKKQELRNEIDLLEIQLNQMDAAIEKGRTYLSTWASSKQNEPWYGKIQTGFIDEFEKALDDIAKNSNLSLAEMQVETKRLGESFVSMQSQIPTDKINDLKKQFDSGKISSSDYNKQLLEQITFIESLSAKYPELDIALKAIANQYRDTFSNSNSFANTTHQLSSFAKATKELEENTSSLSSAYKTLSDGNKLTISQISELIDRYPDLIDYVDIQNGSIKLSKDLLEEKFKIEKQGILNSISLEKQQVNSKLDVAKATLENAKATITLMSVERLREASLRGGSPLDVAKATLENAKATIKLYEAQKNVDDLEKQMSDLQKRYELFSNLSLDTFSSTSSKYENEKLKNYLAELDHKKAIGEYDKKELEYIDKLRYALKNLAKTEEERRSLKEKIYDAEKQYHSNRLRDYLAEIEYEKAMGKYENRDLEYIKKLQYALDNYVLTQEERRNLERQIYEAQKAYQETLIRLEEERIQKLEDAQKKITTLQDMVIRKIKQEQEEKKKALQTELDGLNKVYDARKKALQQLKDEHDYQKSLSEKQKDVSDIQRQLTSISADDSASAKRRRVELENELKKRQDALNEFIYDNDIERQQKQIDAEQKATEEIYNEKIKVVEEYLNDQERLMEDSMLSVQSMTQTLYQELIEYNKKYGDGISSTVVKAWKDAREALEEYNSLVNIDRQISAKNTAYTTTDARLALQAATGKINLTDDQKALYDFDGDGEVTLTDARLILQHAVGKNIYHDGLDNGFVGGVGNSAFMKLMQALNRSGERLSLLQNGEAVISKQQQSSILKNFLSGSSSVGGGIEVNIGDLIIQGDANANTVAQLRRERDNIATTILQSINNTLRIKGYLPNARGLA